MRIKLPVGRIAAVLATFIITAQVSSLAAIKSGPYVDWGVDEYEFFGLTKDAIKKKFECCMCFHAGFERVHFKGCEASSYLGPTFKLGFKNGKVATVQGIFEGCLDTIYRPLLTSKKEALKFAIAGLSDAQDAAGKKKLAAARKELATVEASP